MKEYIEKSAFLKKIDEEFDPGYGEILLDPCVFVELVESIPAADVAEVVRCRDCFCFEDGMVGWCNHWQTGTDGTGYCSYGERRNDQCSTTGKTTGQIS